MEQLERELAGYRTRVCLRQIQEKHFQFQALRAGRIESGDAKSFARSIMAHGGAAAAIRKAIKASGVIVHIDAVELSNILRKTDQPLLVYSPPRLLTRSHQYLTSYKGLAFFTKSSEQI